MRLRLLLLSSALLLPLAACGGGSEPAEVEPPPAAVQKPQAPPTKTVTLAPPATDPTPDPLEALRADYHEAMLDPTKATETAPDTFTVKFETTQGDMLIDVTRAWAPNGADRFYNLVKIGFFDDTAAFRVIDGFMCQLGISGDPQVNTVWRTALLEDDPVKESNTAGLVTFAKTNAPNSRTTQIFFNFADNSRLDGMGFAPFGKLRDMVTLNALYAGYGEGAPRGRGPHQGLMQSKGNSYLREKFPEMDYVTKATIVE